MIRPAWIEALGLFGGQGVDSIAVEEFVEGHEGFYDTIAIDGQVAMDFVSHYYPNVLEAMRTRWISPQFIATNRIDSSAGVCRAAGPGPSGDLGAGDRNVGHAHGVVLWPEGAAILRDRLPATGRRGLGLYSAGNDLDIYREWANAIVHGHTSAVPSRRYASGMIALRPDRDGSISGYSGVDELQDRYGEWVIDANLPDPGTPTQPVAAGYMANAYVRMRHPGLRHAAADARRGRAHAARVRASESDVAGTAAQAHPGPVAAALPPGQPVGHDHRRLAGARERRRRAERAARRPDVNLNLYWRWGDVQDNDPDFAAGERNLAAILDEAQALYLVRLTSALQAVQRGPAP